MTFFKRLYAQKWVRLLLWHSLGIGAFAALAIFASLHFVSACPSYLFFNVCCPYCGMTRAHLAALRLDFASAFYYHPVFFTGVPFLWMLLHAKLFRKKWQKVLWWVALCLMGAALLITYVWRVCILGFDFFG